MNVEPLTPISSVKVIRSVPFDSAYKDVMDFSNTSSQLQFFTSKAKETFTNLQPISISRNAIKLPKPADYFYDCNYIMFQNANFNMKWFFAFITEIEYVNTNMSIVHFELDVYQTWLFDISIKESFVEREHSLTDNVGDNLQVENVDIGNYIERPYEKPSLGEYYVVIATSWLPDSANGELIGGLYSGVKYLFMPCSTDSDVSAINTMLDNFTTANKVDSIVSLFMIPSQFIPIGDGKKNVVQKRFGVTKYTTKLGNYTPRNKKLLTYPYNYLYAFTTEGANSIYKYEMFQAVDECGFLLLAGMSCNFEIVALPIAYNNQQFNFDELLTLGNFPLCSYDIDTFKIFMSQSAVSLGLGLASNYFSYSTSGLSGQVGAILGGSAMLNNVVQATQKPPSIKGNINGNTLGGSRDKNFYFVNRFVTEEYARVIDDYFDMFGYATNLVKVPNLNNRPSWNYVKTMDIKITGSIPFNDMVKIKNIYNNGVTIWHGNFIGDYSRTN